MKQLSKLVIIFVALILAGCPVKPSGIAHLNAPSPSLIDGKGALYIMHRGSAEGVERISFEINGSEVIALADGEYTWVELAPGKYSVTNRTGFMSMDLSGRNPSHSTHEVEIKAGEKSYYNFSYTLRSMNYGTGVSFAGGTPIPYAEPIGYYQRNFRRIEPEQFERWLGWSLYNEAKK